MSVADPSDAMPDLSGFTAREAFEAGWWAAIEKAAEVEALRDAYNQAIGSEGHHPECLYYSVTQGQFCWLEPGHEGDHCPGDGWLV